VTQLLVFLVVALLLIILAVVAWRFWLNYSQITPEIEEFEERLADLNEVQANRYSDGQLRHVYSPEEAWEEMIDRGRRRRRRRRRRRPRH
jgi:type II secretory pathway pseudopilin PulG